MRQHGREEHVVIVGAGPAGMAAAATTAGLGLRTTLLDEGHGLGGQYYKHYTAAEEVPRGAELDDLYNQGKEKEAALRSLPIRIVTDCLVWGYFEPNTLAISVDDEVELLEPTAIIFATGAMEKVAAFPGWTQPGVMTAGAAQRLLSHEGILPGRRFVMAGTGPLLLSIATQIAEAGGEVLAVADCLPLTAPVRSPRTALQAMRQPGRFLQWLDYQRLLRRHRIPYLHEHTVTEARGDENGLQEVTLAKKDASWRPVEGTERTLEADVLCLHYGFVPSIELPQLAGCELTYSADRGGWHVTHDSELRTSVPGIYVAGQTSGIGGADLAEATGELAGLTVAGDRGLLTGRARDERVKRAQRKVANGRGFAEMLNLVYVPDSGIANLATDTTLLCRCEEVDLARVDRAIDDGAQTLNDLKRYTRTGMGFCQGRICCQTLSTHLAHRGGIPAESSSVFTARAPIKPVSLSALATIPASDAPDQVETTFVFGGSEEE